MRLYNTIVTVPFEAFGPIRFNGDLYIVSGDKLFRIDGNVATEVASGLGLPLGLLEFEDGILVTDLGGGLVRKVNFDEFGAVTTVDVFASGLPSATSLTLASDGGVILSQQKEVGRLVHIDANGTVTEIIETSELSYPRGILGSAGGGVELSLPSVTASPNEAVSLPLNVTATDGLDILSYEVALVFDSSLLLNVQALPTGALSNDWTALYNVVDGPGTLDTLKIAAANSAPLSGAGALLYINFTLTDVPLPSASPLTFGTVLFNIGGSITSTTTDGELTLVGTNGTIDSSPAQIIPRQDITVTVVDADLNTAFSTAQTAAVAVTNGAQTETLTLTENGVDSDEFTGTLSTAFSLGFTSDDGIVQAQAGDVIIISFTDELDALGDGPFVRTDQTDVIGGVDGSVAVTQVSQPGDPLYIQVTDTELNTLFSTAETVVVTVVNSRTLESFAVELTEVDVDDAVFFGSLVTVPGASTATEMNTAEEDIVTVTYDDVVTALGAQVDRTAPNAVIDPWGDADDNESLQAFDAAQVLLDVLSGGTQLSGVGRLAADVADPFAVVSPFDAARILQKRVGLIATFPVQAPASANHPQGTPASAKGLPEVRALTLQAGEGYWSVWASDRSGLVAGDLLLEGIQGRVEMGDELASFLSASRPETKGLHIVFAGAEGVEEAGELLRVVGHATAPVQLIRAVFNDGRIEAIGTGSVDSGRRPTTTALHANAPNPFNPETTIGFELAASTGVRLEVFDLLGQKVRTLVARTLPAGSHQAVWDGRDDAGIQVGSGVYVYRLQAGDFTRMRRMLLLK